MLNDVHFRYSINPKTVTDRCRDDRSLLIVVISAPGNFLHRKLIRRTWVTHLKGIQYAFLIGSTDQFDVQQDIRKCSSRANRIRQGKLDPQMPTKTTAGSLKGLLECWLMETKSIRRSTMRKKIRKLFSPKPKKQQFD